MPKNELRHRPVLKGRELTYERPANPVGADPKTLRAIRSAWDERAYVDGIGHIWVEVDRLHVVLRTSVNRARTFAAYVPVRDFVTVGGVRYVRAWHVFHRIDLDINQNATLRRSDYLEYSEKHYQGLRDDNQTKLLRAKHLEALNGLSRKLRKERVRRLDLSHDELTREPLARHGSHFAHILARSLHPEFTDCVWNGLVVNPSTHEQLTVHGAMNDVELLQFCAIHGYSTAWHPPFSEALAEARRSP